MSPFLNTLFLDLSVQAILFDKDTLQVNISWIPIDLKGKIVFGLRVLYSKW